MQSLGIAVMAATWPDYFPNAPGARADRSIICPTFDGRELGEHFTLMREQYTRFKLLNRYAMDLAEFFALSTRAKGWRRVLMRILDAQQMRLLHPATPPPADARRSPSPWYRSICVSSNRRFMCWTWKP